MNNNPTLYERAAKQAKSERTEAAKEARNRKLEKKLLERGYAGLEEADKKRVMKCLDDKRVLEIEKQRKQKLRDRNSLNLNSNPYLIFLKVTRHENNTEALSELLLRPRPQRRGGCLLHRRVAV